MFWILAASAFATVAYPASAAAQARRSESPVAFVRVHVVPMDRERTLRSQTVLVRDGRIEAIGPASAIEVPEGATVVDGGDSLYLGPGLADMHSHVDSLADMVSYLANGVTTLLTFSHEYEVSKERARIARGEVLAPQLFVVRHFVGDGQPTPEQGREMVDLAMRSGDNFIKVYSFWPPESFYATMRYAREKGFPVVGHGVRPVGMRQTLDSGVVMIAHAEEFMYTFFEPRTNLEQIPDAIQLLRANRAWVTANLSAYEALTLQTANRPWMDSVLASYEAGVLRAEQRAEWRQSEFLGFPDSVRGRLQARLAFLQRMVKQLSDSGVPLLAGTDSPLQGMIPGYSLHNELRILEAAGLRPYQVIAAATSNPGRFIALYVPGVNQFGVVVSGARADLVLLRGNPLTQTCFYADPVGVMIAGRWLPESELEDALHQLVASRAPVIPGKPASTVQPPSPVTPQQSNPRCVP